MAHLVLDVVTGPAMAPAVAAVPAGLGPSIPPADGNVDPPVAININPCPPAVNLTADADAVLVNQPPLAIRKLEPPPSATCILVPLQ